MEDLVATGIAGLVGLVVAIVAFLCAILFFAGAIYAAYLTGNTPRLLILCAIPVIIAVAYVGAGLWLRKHDRI